MLKAIIITYSDAYSQNLNIKKYCFDSTEINKINKIIAERDYLKIDILQYEKLDSINKNQKTEYQNKINNLEKIIIENSKIINDLEARPPTIINNAKWYYYAGCVITGIIAGGIITIILK